MMKKKSGRKLQLNRETLRTLATDDLNKVAGGISGLKGCHTIDDICHESNACGWTDGCPTGLWSQCVCD